MLPSRRSGNPLPAERAMREASMSEENVVDPKHGRRDLMKKAAVAGAVAWTVPHVISVGPAGAQPSDPNCSGNCVDVTPLSPVKVTGVNQNWDVPLNLQSACPGCYNASLSSVGAVTPISSDNIIGFSVNTTRLRFAIEDCDQDVSFVVQVPIAVSCDGNVTNCCLEISVSMTSNGDPTDCSATGFTLNTFDTDSVSGAC